MAPRKPDPTDNLAPDPAPKGREEETDIPAPSPEPKDSPFPVKDGSAAGTSDR